MCCRSIEVDTVLVGLRARSVWKQERKDCALLNSIRTISLRYGTYGTSGTELDLLAHRGTELLIARTQRAK
jgi:hypothetical protein